MQLDNPTHLVGRCALSALSGAGLSTAGFGVIVASGDPDLTTVPTLFPDPVLDPEADWIYRAIMVQPLGAVAATFQNGGADTVIVTRSRRKIPNGSGLLGV
ncbi:hypothetical protein, partial [Clostridium diolis]|uniref:hypothetical protein n=1 Tax=Clostridium diolis TaxID=223919 RepID=UPI0019D4972E